MTPSPRPPFRGARFVIRAFAPLVPRAIRDEWQQEWHARACRIRRKILRCAIGGTPPRARFVGRRVLAPFVLPGAELDDQPLEQIAGLAG